MEKRRFYNTGTAKGFTKAIFFKAVLDLANGEDIGEMIDLVAAAAEYELEGINLKAEKGDGEAKDPLASDYAQAIVKDVISLIGAEPMTAKELSEAATKLGKLAPSGKPYAPAWIARVAKNTVGIVVTEKIVNKVDAKNLKSQAMVAAYMRG